MATPEQRVDVLLDEFDKWFQQRGNDPVVRSERAIMKTFCWFLMNVRERSTIPVVEGEQEKCDK
jgi:hypothetical protein